MIKKLFILLVAVSLVAFGSIGWVYYQIKNDLPPIESVHDYKPLLVTQVFDRHQQKMGEFFKERRHLVAVHEIPPLVIQAFLAAEDDTFYQHQGINWLAILRAAVANLRAGHTVQGASTITQQLVKTLFLTPEKTYKRKITEILLAQKLESKLKKDEILYLYLNQIFFGQNSYGIGVAAETYFRKSVKDLNVAEAAILAGLPKAPSAYSPVRNPKRAKERQIYVLNRMADLGYIPKNLAEELIQMPIKVYLRESFVPQSHGVVETVRLLLAKDLTEEKLETEGYQITTTIDLNQQIMAQKAVEEHLRDLDKRQGYRGPLEQIKLSEQWPEYLENLRTELFERHSPERLILPSGEFEQLPPFNSTYSAKRGLPIYLKFAQSYRGLILEVNDSLGYAIVQIGELKALIDVESTRWARSFNPETRSYALARLSTALSPGDVVEVRVKSLDAKLPRIQKLIDKNKTLKPPPLADLALATLEQEPQVEAALLSLDNQSQDVMVMVGGYSFKRSQFNRVLQAQRQTGSSFKTFVYAASLDRGFHPSSLLLDAPIVYENQGKKFEDEWKPTNHSRSYDGDVTLRNALIRSLNVPAVKLVEEIGVPFALDYARRLQITSKLNDDFTLVLGSSSVTLFEMTKAFSIFARNGKNMTPRIVVEVKDRLSQVIIKDLSLDLWFGDTLTQQKAQFEERRQLYLSEQKLKQTAQAAESTEPSTEEPVSVATRDIKIEPSIFFEDPEQLISPATAYLMTSLLTGVIRDPNGTAARVNGEISFPVAGKTGSSNDYVDGWFIGYSPLVTTGVWVGFDQEKTLGPSEVGGRTALPIWTHVMKALHPTDPEQLANLQFLVPEGVTDQKVEYDTGLLAKPKSRRVILQPFRQSDLKKLEAATESDEQVESAKDDFNE